MRAGFRRLFRRSKTPPVLDPVGYRLPSYLVDPREPTWGPLDDQASSQAESQPSAGSSTGAQETPRFDPPAPTGPPQVRLMMADGSVQDLPEDPETARKAAYYVRSMLSPPPPPPPPGGSQD